MGSITPRTETADIIVLDLPTVVQGSSVDFSPGLERIAALHGAAPRVPIVVADSFSAHYDRRFRDNRYATLDNALRASGAVAYVDTLQAYPYTLVAIIRRIDEFLRTGEPPPRLVDPCIIYYHDNLTAMSVANQRPA